jgi:hypothetical protein
VKYLCHIVSHEGIKMDSNKIKSMMEWPTPKTLKNIRGFLGLMGYYHMFVKNCSNIESHLIILLKHEEFYWIQEATEEFGKLKDTINTIHMLVMSRFVKAFIMKCYALGHGINVVLM